MKKINIIYIALIPVVIGAFYINWNYARHAAVFYGFAENKETEINHDHPVQIEKIYVSPGQFVNKGDLLMHVTHSKFEIRMNDLTFEMDAIKLKVQEQKSEIQRAIRKLENDRIAKIADIESSIQKLQAEIDLNRSLLKDLTSVELQETEGKSPNEIRMESLRQDLKMVNKAYDLQYQQLQEELAAIDGPFEVERKKLESEHAFYKGEKQKLSILAPSDGLIGNIHCLEGENKSSFSTLITFYERNPTEVKGYVHENLIVHVNVGDTLEVTSILHPEHNGYGVVVGLGSRIVEIPDRLRKMPDIKTYGREVLIEIPPENPFLQKEKVVLNFLNPSEVTPKRLIPIKNKSQSLQISEQEASIQK